ncbi:MAG: sigma-70 family RNA polymerase sigma factor, partial [Peptococcaceae bacterium]|nr:sigma-70 family RNA polymerase sigma factor [Peptococcaceae bacterium]
IEQLEQRDVVILQMFAEGYSESVIAKTIGMSQKGVNKRKHKALAQLRAQLQEFDV